MKKIDFPVRHHFDCMFYQCQTCLDDHGRLAEYIEASSGLSSRYHDFLGEYRSWLDANEIYAEGKDGWATRESWDKKNVDAFVATILKGEGE